MKDWRNEVYNDSNSLEDYIDDYHEIIRYKTRPFHLSNKPLAEYYLSKIIRQYPQAKLIDYNGSQWICLNDKHIRYVTKYIKEKIISKQNEIKELQKLLTEIEV